MNSEQLFNQLYFSGSEQEIELILNQNSEIFKNENWFPLGQNLSNFSIVKNQQANPIAALIEKITNSIDAILTKKCFEAGIDPKSSDAPRSIQQAVEDFFEEEHKTWDLDSFRREQAKDIQVIADGEPRNTSVVKIGRASCRERV